MNKKQLIAARILFVVYLAAVAWLCFGKFNSLPSVERSYWGIPTDKIVHFLMFFPFPVLAFFAFDRYTEQFWPSVLWTLGTFIAGCGLAGLTEIVQAKFLPYRMGDFQDFKADALALAISSVIVFCIDIGKQRKK